MGYARTRLSARHIASEVIEQINNLPYNDIGTTTGIPTGILEEYQTINRNGLDYTIHTSVIYIDDNFDGTTPTDLLPTDYKQVRVEVSWEGQFASRAGPIVLSTNIAPKGIETEIGGGTISVLIFNAQAEPVSQADVHIINTQVTPNIDTTLQTNSDGRIILPGAPACLNCYQITISKNNYSTDRTYSTDEIAYPDKYHLTVTEGDLSEITFVIDIISTLQITTTRDESLNFAPFPGVTFQITGAKTLGTDLLGDYVYKYQETLTTDGNGNYNIENLEWDSYTITIPETENLNISGSNPAIPFPINPNTDNQTTIALQDLTTHNLLINILDATGNAIASASAILNLTSPPYEASASSGLEGNPNWGQVFFPNLIQTTYDYTINHPSYQEDTGQIIVNGPSTDTIIMQEAE
jgi:hypothetical protein